jgi:hypothetical protein
MFVAMPVHGGVQPESMATVFGIILKLRGSSFGEIHNCAIIEQARAELVALFLESKEKEILFIDSDISFHPIVAVKLQQAKGDVVSCSYRRRMAPFDWSYKNNGNVSLSNMEKRVVDDIRIVSIDYNGLGCCLIQRHVIEKLILLHPELNYESDSGKERHHLFECGIREKEGKRIFISEDYAFFERVRAAGFRTECLLDAPIKHGEILDQLTL